jgi:hypothetical protein
MIQNLIEFAMGKEHVPQRAAVPTIRAMKDKGVAILTGSDSFNFSLDRVKRISVTPDESKNDFVLSGAYAFEGVTGPETETVLARFSSKQDADFALTEIFSLQTAGIARKWPRRVAWSALGLFVVLELASLGRPRVAPEQPPALGMNAPLPLTPTMPAMPATSVPPVDLATLSPEARSFVKAAKVPTIDSSQAGPSAVAPATQAASQASDPLSQAASQRPAAPSSK